MFGLLRRSRGSNLLIGVAAVAAVLLTYVGTSLYGIAIYSDGVAFVSTAESVLAGEGLVTFTGSPLLGWPPVYPLLIAAIGSTGVPLAEAARLLNALSFCGIILLTGAILKLAKVGVAELAFSLGSLLFAVTMFDRWRQALSELPFMVLTLLCLLLLLHYVRTGSVRSIVLASAVSGIACLVRYAGVGIVFSGAMTLILQPGTPLRTRTTRALAFSVGSLALFVPWIIRNIRLSGSWSGVQSFPATRSAADGLRALLDVFGQWIVPPRVPSDARVVIAGALIVLCAWALIFGVRSFTRNADDSSLRGTVLLGAGTFTLGYTFFVLASISGMHLDSELTRLLSPSLPTLIIVVTIAADETRRRLQARRLPGYVAAVPLGLMLVWPLRFTVGAGTRIVRVGAGGYATADWQSSDLLKFAAQTELPKPVYSNEAAAFYVIAGMRGVRQLPAHSHPESPIMPDSALRIIRRESDGHSATVVLFDRPTLERFRYTEQDIRSAFTADVVARRADGIVFRVE